jgi:acyl carrier protein
MSTLTAEVVRQFVAHHYQDRLPAGALTLGKDTDLLDSGIIDSFGILELVQALETHFSIRIDLEGLEPEKLTLVGPLCAYVAAKAVPAPPALQ